MRFNPLNNLTLKIGAVLLALLLWVHVATNKTYEHQVDMVLQVANIPKSLVLVSEIPSIVTVRVKTTGKQLIALAAKQHVLTLDGSQFHEGAFEHDLSDRDAAAAFDQVYERVDVVFPRKLFIRLERLTEKSVLIEPGVRANAAPGFLIVGQTRIEPAMVRVAGPSSVMRNLKSIMTEAVELNGLTTSASHKVRLFVPDSLHLSLGDSSATISIDVEPMKERVIGDLAIHAPYDFDAAQYTFAPTTVALRLGFPVSMRDSLDLKKLKVTFAALGDYRDSVRAPLKYTLPKNATIVGHSLDSVMIYRR